MTLRANGVTIEIKGDADVTIEGDRVTVRTRREMPVKPEVVPPRYEDAWIQSVTCSWYPLTCSWYPPVSALT